MPPKSTRSRAAPKAEPIVNGTSTKPNTSKKRKAVEEPKPPAATSKRQRGFGAVLEVDAKRPKSTKAKAAAAPAPAASFSSSFSAEPVDTLKSFTSAPPDTSDLPVINNAPTDILTVYAFGTGDMSGELGLGPKKKEAKRATVVPKLDGRDKDAYHVVQVDCGGMHSLALTADSKIVSWGCNDKGALGRDTNWDGGLRDMDAEKAGSDSDSDDEDVNPLESTPTHIPENSFPKGTKFTSVAAGDSCSFAVTETGLVYGWGTFLVSSKHPQTSSLAPSHLLF